MQLIDIERPIKKVVPDPIIACKVSRETQAAFDLLAEKTYECTRAELMRACVLDCLKRHAEAIKK
tara:strand:+ start:109 stop:303 length:195 start_codon:yes stop_codon:yes gene_type:complete